MWKKIFILSMCILLTGCVVETYEVVYPEKEQIITSPGNLVYVLNGEIKNISIELNSSLNEYLENIPRKILCSPVCPPESEIQMKFLNNKKQNKYLDILVRKIQNKSSDAEEQARIAVSIVQHIPYDYERAESLLSNYGKYARGFAERYPYEVIHDNKGICEEKARLLVYLLRELGFGTALIAFENENHMAAGIKCDKYSFKKEYCYIETTKPLMITKKGQLIAGDMHVELKSEPKTIRISKGASFDAEQEYLDNLEYTELIKKRQLEQEDYQRYLEITKKYGMT